MLASMTPALVTQRVPDSTKEPGDPSLVVPLPTTQHLELAAHKNRSVRPDSFFNCKIYI